MVGGHSGLLEVGCAVLLRVQDLTWQDSFGDVRGLDVDWGAGGAPRVCVKEVMLLAGEAGGEGAATLQRVVGKDLSARAGWVVCGDAEDVYTGSVHDFLFRTCPRLVFGASACPFLSLGAARRGRQRKK